MYHNNLLFFLILLTVEQLELNAKSDFFRTNFYCAKVGSIRIVFQAWHCLSFDSPCLISWMSLKEQEVVACLAS